MIEEQSQLKYLSEMSYWMRNKYSYFAFGVYRSVSILLIFYFFYRCHAKCVINFSLFLLWPRWSIDLKPPQVCQFMVMVDYINCLFSKKQFKPSRKTLLGSKCQAINYFLQKPNQWCSLNPSKPAVHECLCGTPSASNWWMSNVLHPC